MYRWIDHTAEVELELRAASEAEVFADALTALAELLGVVAADATKAGEQRTITISAGDGADRAALLAAWLEELVYIAESDGFVATRLADLELRPSGLVAHVEGVVAEPPPLVKAVTLHRLRFDGAADGYVAGVVLDV